MATASLVVGVPPGFPVFYRRERKDSRRYTLMEGNPRGWAKRRRSPMCWPVAAIARVSSGRHCPLAQTDAQSASKTLGRRTMAYDRAPVGYVLEFIGYRVVPASSCGGTIRAYALGIRGYKCAAVRSRSVPSTPYTLYSSTSAESR